jgi:3-hydroxybutyryl-CoA dehydrogenase
MSIEHILVVGAGQMGAGIAQVALQAGFQVTLADVAEASLAKGKAGIEKGLAKMVEKGKLDAAAKDAALKKFSTTPSILDAKNVDAAIEAVTENEELKKKMEFTEITPAVREAMRKASAGVIDEVKKRAGAPLVDSVLAEVGALK